MLDAMAFGYTVSTAVWVDPTLCTASLISRDSHGSRDTNMPKGSPWTDAAFVSMMGMPKGSPMKDAAYVSTLPKLLVRRCCVD